VGEAKAEIARVKGTKEDVQKLYKVATRADGKAVREDDAEPEVLGDDGQSLGDGELLAMAVKEAPLIWRTYPGESVTPSEKGALATKSNYIRLLSWRVASRSRRTGTTGRWRLWVITWVLA
jgi:hypothetical protein